MMHYCAQLNFSFVLATSLHGPVQGLHQLHMALVPDIIRRQTAACAASESTSGGVCMTQDPMVAGMCPAGFVKNTSTTRCQLCKAGMYCAHGQEYRCPEFSNSYKGTRSARDCLCLNGYCQKTRDSERVYGGFGFYSQTGWRFPCGLHTKTLVGNSTRREDCKCLSGYQQHEDKCELHCEFSRVLIHTTKQDACSCPANSYYNSSEIDCLPCVYGSVCPVGVSEQVPVCDQIYPQQTVSALSDTCVRQTGYCSPSPVGSELAVRETCQPFPVGFFCNETAGLVLYKCPAGETSLLLSAKLSDCFCTRLEFMT